MVKVSLSACALMLWSSFAGGPAVAATPGVHWHVMGGYSATLGTTSDYLQGGYALGGGLSITPSAYSPFAWRFDLDYANHQASTQLIALGQQNTNVQIDSGTGQVWSFSGNAVYHVPISYNVRAYGIAGVGVYHTRIELTQTVPFYGGYYYCDPFWGFCDTGYGYGNAVVTSHDITKFGWNAGVGLEFALPQGQSWFVEARYHRISADTPIEFVPLEVGYRF